MSEKSLAEEVAWVRTDLAYAAPEQITVGLLAERLGRIFAALDRQQENAVEGR